MSKKIIIVLIIFIAAGCILSAKGMKFELKGHYYLPQDSNFKEVYSSGIAFGGEFSYKIWKGFSAWFGGSSFSKGGEFTFSNDKTDVKIIPFELGVQYTQSLSEKFSLYGGVGLAYVLFDEENFLGAVTQNKLGVIATVGVMLHLKSGLFVDVFFDYLMCSLQPGEVEFSISGMMTGIGVGIVF